MPPRQGKSQGPARGRTKQQQGAERLYGFHTVEAALRNPDRHCHRLLASENASQRLKPVLAQAHRTDLDLVVARTDEMAALCHPGAVHQGVVLETEPLIPPGLEALTASAQLLVVLDQVSDPQNIGAILRSCAAFGADALVAAERSMPRHSAVLAKAASGALEHVPLVTVTNLSRALVRLGKSGFFRIGLDGAAQTDLADAGETARCVLVCGAEGSGLRRLTAENCDLLARLPLPGPIKSLNVSNAAAVALSIATGHGARERK